MTLATTAIYAALCAFWYIWLAFQVIKWRRDAQISIMTGGDQSMANRMRAHGNAAEYIPIFLILMAVNESMGTPWFILHLLGIVFLVGRVLHGLHFVQEREGLAWRFRGMLMTFSAIALSALGALAHGIAGQF